ncbi:MAG: hypothetical protein MRY63_02970 [Neomegalonema sp.]|nr:hypothetical protein [Neomegalonema sp.]
MANSSHQDRIWFEMAWRKPAIAGICGLLLTLSTTACTADDPFAKVNLPESESVQSAQWPRLVDVPPPAAEGTQFHPDQLRQRGARLQQNLSSQASSVRARKTVMDAGELDDTARARQAAALRARLQRLRENASQ